jgi:hypothetical protein
MSAKSLGEKLNDAIWQPLMYTSRAPWNALGLDSRASYEVAALAFAASLYHDETATATITALEAEVGRLREVIAEAVKLARLPSGVSRSSKVTFPAHVFYSMSAALKTKDTDHAE